MANTYLKIIQLSDVLPEVRCPPAIRVVDRTDAQLETYELMQEEADATTHFSAKRLREFRLGRAAARELLSTMGFADFPVRVGSSRQPIWPAELTGSISHAGNVAVCAIAEKQYIAGLGIDIEIIAPESFDLFTTVASEGEQEYLHTEKDCDYLAKLLFSAKESVFKCQFPLTGKWLEFNEVTLELDFDNRLFTTAVTHQHSNLAIAGSWNVNELHIMTTAWIL